MIELFQKLNEDDGITVILVTHDQAVARNARRTVVLRDGVITSVGAKVKAPDDARVWDVDGELLANGRTFAELIDPVDGSRTSADGIRCDVDGNVWAGARPGVQVVAPDGDTIGVIRLPEVCANICFGGAKRNRLFMTASQSLYSVYVGVRGAGVA